MDYTITYEDLHELKGYISLLKKEIENKEVQIQKLQKVLDVERHTTSLVLKKLESLNHKVARLSNHPTRVYLDDLIS